MWPSNKSRLTGEEIPSLSTRQARQRQRRQTAEWFWSCHCLGLRRAIRTEIEHDFFHIAFIKCADKAQAKLDSMESQLVSDPLFDEDEII